MQLTTLSLLASSLLAICSAAPAALESRQTYLITCIGGKCQGPSFPQPEPTPAPIPSSSKKPTSAPAKTSTTSSKYTPPPVKSTPQPSKTKTTQQPTKTGNEETGPSSTKCPIPEYYKCGGWDYDKPWSGCTVCEKGLKCVEQNEWYYQCVKEDSLVEDGMMEE